MSGDDAAHDGLNRLSRADVADALERRRVDDDPTSDPTVGVLLAAGGSSRFGADNKLLAAVGGEALVCRAARTLRDARVSCVVVVLGHQPSAVRDAVAGLDGWAGSQSEFVTNPDYDAGLSTSVRAGVEKATELGGAAVVFLPADMPAVAAGTVDLLVDAYRAGVTDAVAAGYRDRRGNPVCFGREHFGALRAATGDVGGRSILLESQRGAVLETDDPGVLRDINTRRDLGDCG